MSAHNLTKTLYRDDSIEQALQFHKLPLSGSSGEILQYMPVFLAAASIVCTVGHPICGLTGVGEGLLSPG